MADKLGQERRTAADDTTADFLAADGCKNGDKRGARNVEADLRPEPFIHDTPCWMHCTTKEKAIREKMV